MFNKRMIFFVLTLAVMVAIFVFSAQNSEQSGMQSGRVTEFIVKILRPDFFELALEEQQALIEAYQGIIRTLAHACIFAALGFCSGGFANTYNTVFAKRFIFTLVFCIFYAITDEIHQIFTPGRAFQVFDILVDTLGAIIGILAITLLCMIIRKDRQNEKHSSK